MDDGDWPGASPEEAFSQVADETRFEILTQLWDVETESGIEAVPFSDLRKRVGMRDSGRFNYHLDKLTPSFVRRHEEGYALTHAGRQIVGAVVSGTFTDAGVTTGPVRVHDCPDCGGAIDAEYERGVLDISCRECGLRVTSMDAPPVLAESHDPVEFPTVFAEFLAAKWGFENRGFCSLCGGPTEKSVRVDEEDDGDGSVTAGLACEACGRQFRAVVGATVLDHPAVVSFLYDHGIDVRTTPFWELDWLSEPHAHAVQAEPLRIEMAVDLDGERLELTLDDSLTVLDHQRTTDGE